MTKVASSHILEFYSPAFVEPSATAPDFDQNLTAAKEAVQAFLLKKTHNFELAEDLAQEALLRAHRFRESFDPQKGNFTSWLIRIAHNLFLTYLQKKQRGIEESPLTPEQESLLASTDTETSKLIEQKILFESIKQAIACLPEPERTVIYNKEIRQTKLSDTAQELGISVRTVSRKLLSGYDLLRKKLIEQGIVPEGFVLAEKK